MATEGDDQEPIPITKREKEDKDLTKGHSDTTVDQFPPGELKIIDSGPNQPLETVTYMVKKENAEPASYLGENVSTVFEGNVGASEGDKFLESPLVAKVADTEPSRVPEDYLADEKPNQAEKETVDNKTQLQKEQKIEFKEEKRDGTEKSETNHDMISTVMVKREETLEKEKIFDQSDEITNVKLSIEEKPPSTDEASSCSQEEQTDGTNTDINTAFECRKQVLERQEASPGQNEEAPVLTTDLRVDSLNMHNGIVPEAPNKEESIDNTCSTNPTSIQDEFAETSSGGEKYKESDESSMSNVKSHSGIQNDEEATMEVGNDAEGQLDSPYIPKIIEEVRLQKAGLEVEGRLEETSTDKFKSIEKMEDIIPVKDENKEKSLDTPLVKEDVSFQNAYKEETFKDGSVIGSEEIVESPKEVEIQNEVLERTTQADSTTSEMVKVVKDLEQKLDDSFIKHKACLQRDGAELTLTEASNEDNRDGEGFTVTEAEDNNSNTEPIIAEGHGKQGISKHGEGPAQSEQDELEIEKFERSLNVNSEEIETAASSEYDEKIAHVREQEPAENNEESFKGIEKAEKPTNADDFIKNATPIKKDLPHIDMNNKIQNAEVEVPKRYSNDLQLLLTEETEQGQGEEKNEVSKSESKKQVDDTTTSSTVEEKQIDDPPEVCKIAETISEHMSTRSVKTMELISNKSKVEMEKLVQLYELDTKKKLEVEDAREVQNKDDAADMEGDKITAKREEDGPVKIRSTVSIEEETIEQSLEETAPELRSGDHSHKAEKNNNIDDEVHDKPSTTGIDKAFQGQIIKYSNVTGLQPEAIEETVKSIQHDEKEAQKSGGEDTEDHTEQLSPEPIGEDLPKTHHDDKKELEKSKGEIFEASNTPEASENIAWEKYQNDRDENGSCTIVNDNKDDNTRQVKTAENTSEENEDSAEILHKNETTKNLEDKVNVMPEESKATDSNATAETIICVKGKRTIQNLEEDLDLVTNIESGENEVMSRGEISEFETATAGESIACETNQNDEIQEGNSIEASLEEKDEKESRIIVTKNNDNTVLVKVEKNQEDKISKYKEDSKEILQKNESGEELVHMLDVRPKESEAAASSEDAEEIINVKEEGTTENLEEAVNIAKNFETDKNEEKKSKGEISDETKTETVVESIAREINQNDEIPERVSMEDSMEKHENGPCIIVTEENNDDTTLVKVEKSREDKILKDKEDSKEILQKDESREEPVHKLNATPEESMSADSSENSEEIIHVDKKATIENCEEALDLPKNIEVNEKEVKKSKAEISDETETDTVVESIACETNQNDEMPERISIEASMEEKDGNGPCITLTEENNYSTTPVKVEKNQEDKMLKDEEDSKEILQKDESGEKPAHKLNAISKDSAAADSSENAEGIIHVDERAITENLEEALDLAKNIEVDEEDVKKSKGEIYEETETDTVESIVHETNQNDEVPERISMEASMEEKDENGPSVTEENNNDTSLVNVEKNREDKILKDKEGSKEILQKDESEEGPVHKFNATPEENAAADSSENAEEIIHVEEKATIENLEEALDPANNIEVDEKEVKKSKGETSEESETARVDVNVGCETNQNDEIPERISMDASMEDKDENNTEDKISKDEEDSKEILQKDESRDDLVQMLNMIPKESNAFGSSEDAEETIHAKNKETTGNLEKVLDIVNIKADEKMISEETETATVDESIACETNQTDEIPERKSMEPSMDKKDENGSCITVTEDENEITALVEVEKSKEDKLSKDEEDSKEISQKDESGQELIDKLNAMPKEREAADSSEDKIINVEEKGTTENVQETLDLVKIIEADEKEAKKSKGEVSEWSKTARVDETIVHETDQTDKIPERISVEDKNEIKPCTSASDNNDNTTPVKVEYIKEDSKVVVQDDESGKVHVHMPKENKAVVSSEEAEETIHVKEEGTTENLAEALDLIQNTKAGEKEISEEMETATMDESIACESIQNDEIPERISREASVEEKDENGPCITVTENNNGNTTLVKVEKNGEDKILKHEEDSKEILQNDESGEEPAHKLNVMPKQSQAADSSENAEEIIHVEEKASTENLKEALDLNVEDEEKEVKKPKGEISESESVTVAESIACETNQNDEILERIPMEASMEERDENGPYTTVSEDSDDTALVKVEKNKEDKISIYDEDSKEVLEKYESGEELGHMFNVMPEESKPTNSSEDTEKIIHVKEEGATENLKEALDLVKNTESDKKEVKKPKEEISEKFEMAAVGETIACEKNQNDETPDEISMQDSMEETDENASRIIVTEDNKDNTALVKVEKNKEYKLSKDEEDSKEMLHKDEPGEELIDKLSAMPMEREAADSSEDAEEIMHVKEKGITENLEEGLDLVKNIEAGRKEIKNSKEKVPKIVQTVDKGEDIVKQIMEENDTAKDDFEASVQEHKEEKKPVEEKEDKGFDKEVFETTSACKDTKEQIVKEIDNKDNSIEFSEKETVRESSQENEVEDSKLEFIKMTEATGFAEEIKTETLKDSTELIKYLNASNTTAEETRPKCGNEDFFENSSLVFEGSQEKIKVELLKKEEAISDDSETADVAATTEETSHVEPEDKRQIESSGPHDEEDLAETSGTTIDGETVEETSSFSECKDEETSTTERDDERKESSTLTSKEHGPLITEVSETIEMTLPAENGEAEQTTEATTLSKEDMLTNLDDVSISRSTRKKRASEEFQKYGEKEKHSLEPHTRNNSNESKSTESPKRQKTSELANPNEINKSEDSKYEGILKLEFEEDKFEDKKPSEVSSVSIEAITTSPDTDKATQEEENSSKSFEGGLNEGVGVGKAADELEAGSHSHGCKASVMEEVKNHKSLHPDAKLQHTSELMAEEKHVETHDKSNNIEDSNGAEGLNVAPVEEQTIGQTVRQGGKETYEAPEAKQETIKNVISTEEVLHKVEKADESENIKRQIIQEERSDSKELHMVTIEYKTVNEVKDSDLVSFENLKATEYSAETEAATSEPAEDSNRVRETSLVTDAPEEKQTQKGSNNQSFNDSTLALEISEASMKEEVIEETSNFHEKIDTTSIKEITEEASLQEYQLDEKTAKAFGIISEEKTLKTIETTKTSPQGEEIDGIKLKATSDLANSDQESIAVENPDVDTEKTKRTFDAVLESRDLNAKNIDRAEKIMTMEKSSMENFEEEIKEVNETLLKSQHQGVETRTEDEITTATIEHALPAEKSEDQLQKASSALLTKEQKHRSITKEEDAEDDTKENETRENENLEDSMSTKTIEEILLPKEEPGELKPSTEASDVIEDIKNNPNEEQMKEEKTFDGTSRPEPHESESISGAKFAELIPSESENIPGQSLVITQSSVEEILSEVGEKLDETPSLRQEKTGKNSDYVSHVESPEVLTKFEEKKFEEENSKTATAESRAEENWLEEATDTKDVIENKLSNEEIAEEKVVAKDSHPVLGEETAKKSHQGDELTTEEHQGGKTSGTFKIANNGIQIKEVNSNMLFIVHDPSTTVTNDKEIVSTSNGEKPNTNPNTPTTDAAAKEAPHEKGVDKIKEPSEPAPEKLVHEAVKTYEENIKIDTIVTDKSEILVEDKNHKHVSPLSPSDRTGATGSSDLKGQAIQSHESGTSLTESSQKKISDKESKITEDEKQHEWDSDKQITTEVSAAAEVKDAKDKDEGMIQLSTGENKRRHDEAENPSAIHTNEYGGTEDQKEKSSTLSQIQDSSIGIVQERGTVDTVIVNEITRDIKQIDKITNAESGNSIPMEANPNEMATMSHTEVQPLAQNIGVEELEQRNASQIEPELKEVEFREQKRMYDTNEEIAESASVDLAGISLSELLQESKNESQQAAGHIVEDRKPTDTKEEMQTKDAETYQVEEAQTDDEEEGNDGQKVDPGSEAPIIVEASRDKDVKVAHKKSHNLLSGVGSKVKHSIAKVKKVITGKSSHTKTASTKSN
ncbi:uncharacterized protein LOC131168145 isoform X11 [Malania oleifera]|uniref:uncharacterized protein LOC131168145 isoform X11 n=1 Tax=Malania oleifera TaxID=397392 RepID=UPI0025AE019F|nr:uncharacterized protein LOC131168145 isoform X11 [Malania oleifera]